mgnify:CR=1 FL=1|jgi:hypothetical protein
MNILKNIITFMIIAFCARVYTDVIFYQLHNNEVATAYGIIIGSIILVFLTMKPKQG